MSESFHEKFDLSKGSKISDKDKTIFRLFLKIDSLEGKIKLLDNQLLKIDSLKGSIEFLKAMLFGQEEMFYQQESIKRSFFNLILKNSADFDDFKTKYNKYIKFSKKMDESKTGKMNNETIQLHNNIFGFHSNLKPGNNVITKSNGKRGKIESINENRIENYNLGSAKTILKFNNNSTGERNLRNLKKNTSRKI